MNYFLLSTLTLAWLAILVGGCLGWQLLRQNGRMLLRLDELEKRLNELEFGEDHEPGLPVGSAAPDFELADLASDTRTLAQYRGYPVLLVFFNPACGFCRELLPKLSALYGVRRQAERNAALGTLSELNGQDHSAAAAGVLQSNGVLSPCGLTPRLLLLSTGGAEANRQIFNEYQLTCPVLLQKESEAATAYQANGTPSGYLISPDGRIASELAIGEEALLELLGGKPERSEPDRRGNQAEMDQSLRGTVGWERRRPRGPLQQPFLSPQQNQARRLEGGHARARFPPAEAGRTRRLHTKRAAGQTRVVGLFQPELRPVQRAGAATQESSIASTRRWKW